MDTIEYQLKQNKELRQEKCEAVKEEIYHNLKYG